MLLGPYLHGSQVYFIFDLTSIPYILCLGVTYLLFVCCLFVCFAVIKIEPKALFLLGKRSATELHPQSDG